MGGTSVFGCNQFLSQHRVKLVLYKPRPSIRGFRLLPVNGDLEFYKSVGGKHISAAGYTILLRTKEGNKPSRETMNTSKSSHKLVVVYLGSSLAVLEWSLFFLLELISLTKTDGHYNYTPNNLLLSIDPT